METIEQILGAVPQVAVLRLYAHMPEMAAVYLDPYEWLEQGIDGTVSMALAINTVQLVPPRSSIVT
jgi:hypothetical protein